MAYNGRVMAIVPNASYTFPVVVTQDEDGVYVATVPQLAGCHTQARTLPELYERVEEVIAVCLEVERERNRPVMQQKFIGVQQIEVEL